jgi:Ca-activated chloride channel family protein
MKKAIVIMSLVLAVFAGTMARTITGKVTDENNAPLPGVNVIIKGSKQGAVTGLNGEYSINLPDSNAVLVFNYVGYMAEEVKVRKSDIINVVMTPDVTALEEVVVIGYGVNKRSNLTGAISLFRQPVKCNNDATNYYFPAPDFNTEGYSTIHENGYKNPLRAPLSTFSIDVDAASYSNVRRFINNGQKPPIDAARIEEMINYFDYDYPQPDNGHPFSINYELGQCPWNKDHILLHIGLQGEKVETDQVPPSNIVFLIDVSGSMSSYNKLPLLKKAFKLLVKQLREEDRVAIVVYAGSSGLVLPSTRGDQKETIIAALDRLQSGGSTAGAAGLKLAYQVAEENFIEGGNNRIILATDGDFNIGPSSNAEMERLITSYRDKGIFISVTGFGMGNYKDDKMEIIADKGNGNYAYIDNIMEAKKVFINEFSSTLYTIAKDVKIQIEFNPVYVKEYRLIGYENRLLNEEDFEDDKKDAGELGAGHTVTALYEIVTNYKDADKVRTLKYQKSDVLPEASLNNELATIKFRYKKPDGNKSILMVQPIEKNVKDYEELSDNFKFSAAVAGFGMLLRDSKFKGNLCYDNVLQLARKGKGDDRNGYRNEFIRLVELSQHL